MKTVLAGMAVGLLLSFLPACGGDDTFEPPDLAIHFPDMASTDFAQIQGTIDAGPCPASSAAACEPYACEQNTITGAYGCYIDCNCAYQTGCAPGYRCVNCGVENVGTCK